MSKKKYPRHFVIIRWSAEAEEYGVADDYFKEFVYMYHGQPYKYEKYSPLKESLLREKGLVVVDVTGIKKPASLYSSTTQVLGAMQISKVLPG